MNRFSKPLEVRPTLTVEVPSTAMVMAAGLGKRMRPLTATRPKPLVEVAGKPLIDHALDRLEAAGVSKAVVNVHYLADSLEAHLAKREGALQTVISDERDMLLETGGGLVRAMPQIDADPFLAVNSDNLWVEGPIDSLHLLASHWDDEKMDALLLLVPLAQAHCHVGKGDFHMDSAGRLRRRKPHGVAPFVYIGIQMLSKRLFEGELPDGAFSTNILWNRAIEKGRLYGTVHQGLWFDIGRPESIRRAEEMLANL